MSQLLRCWWRDFRSLFEKHSWKKSKVKKIIKVKSKIKFWTIDLICYTWNTVNTNWRMKHFLMLPKYNSMQIQQLQHWCSSKDNLIWRSARNGQAKLKHYCSKFILTSVLICLQSNFLFQPGKKAMKTCIILLHMFLLLQETS